MNLKDWENTLYNIAKNTGDISVMMQYINVAKNNNQNELEEAQQEIYKDEDTLIK